MKRTYVSRSGSVTQMKALETELQKRGFVLVADDAPKKKLDPKQYRRWQIDGKNGVVVTMLWTEDEGEPAWPPVLAIDPGEPAP